MTDRSKLIGLVMVELLAVAGLHALARLDTFAIEWSDLSGWLENTAFEDAFGAVVLVGALVLAYWLLISTVSYLAASASGRPAALGAVQWLTLPPIRRLVSRAVALSIAASAVAGSVVPAVANLTGSTELVVEIDNEGTLHPPGTEEGPEVEDDRGSDVIVPPHLQVPADDEAAESEDVAPPEATIDGTIPHAVTVRRGDHLWSLSQQHLERVLGRSPLGEHEIARYWVRVIEANRVTIRSGDPDLIYPGETIQLPPVHA